MFRLEALILKAKAALNLLTTRFMRLKSIYSLSPLLTINYKSPIAFCIMADSI